MAEDQTDPIERPLGADEQSEIWLHNDGSSERVAPGSRQRDFDASATRKIAREEIGPPSLAEVHADPRQPTDTRTSAQAPLTRRDIRRGSDPEPTTSPQDASPEPAPLKIDNRMGPESDRSAEHLGAVPIVDASQPPPGQTFRSDPGGAEVAPPPLTAKAADATETDGSDFGDFWNADGRSTPEPASVAAIDPEPMGAASLQARPAADPWPDQQPAISQQDSNPTTALSRDPQRGEREVKLGTGAITPLSPSRRSLAPILAALLALLVVGAAILWFFVLRDDTDSTSETPDAVETDNTPEVDVDGGDDGSTAPEVVPETAPTPTTLDATAEVCPDPDSSAWEPGTLGPIVTCPQYPAGQPERALSPPGTGWIADLGTVALDQPDGVAAREAEIVESIRLAEDRIANVGLYDSRSYSGLPDPFWVLFAGPFTSEASVQEYCEARPHLSPCVPRSLE